MNVAVEIQEYPNFLFPKIAVAAMNPIRIAATIFIKNVADTKKIQTATIPAVIVKPDTYQPLLME
jgi:hypothetical protein